jgi:fructokinase
VCAKGTGPGDLTEVEVIPTTTPPARLSRVVEFFKRDSVRVAALGVGTFGPVDLRVGSETFGWITKTAKPGWSNTNVVGALIEELDVPVAFDTDVNAAALAEQRWGRRSGAVELHLHDGGHGHWCRLRRGVFQHSASCVRRSS